MPMPSPIRLTRDEMNGPEQITDHTLDNGLRVVAEHMPWMRSTAVGVHIGAGAAHEDQSRRGISHFIEHMLFKGTARRSVADIAQIIDGVGGVLNAFTDREYTCLYAQVMTEHAELALDVMADMLGASLFDADEFEREKEVVIEEIKKSEDTPEDRVHDLFDETIWPGHPLGQAILGEEHAVRGLSREAVADYYRANYGPQGIVFAVAGSLQPATAVELARRYLEPLTGGSPNTAYPAPRAHPGQVCLARPTEQVHFCIGCEGLALTDNDYWALALVDCALGGGMSSRLFQEIREKRGLVYSIGSHLAGYRGAGLVVASGGARPERWPEVRELVTAETQRLCDEGISVAELGRAREQIKGGMALALENTSYRMRRIGISALYWGRVIPVAEAIANFDVVTPERATAVARRVLGARPLHVAVVGPRDD
jgi:predicted Zn-dependent peptidase